MIPYCLNCKNKTKKFGMDNNTFYCDVVADTPLKGIVTFDTDGTHCFELGIYRIINPATIQTTNIIICQ